MKKNYIIPEIETLEVRATFAICEGSPGHSGVGGGSSWGFAPRRKPF